MISENDDNDTIETKEAIQEAQERYQWKLAKLSPNEYYEYITTGIYPLK